MWYLGALTDCRGPLSGDGIVLVDRDHRVAYYNPQVAHLVNIPLGRLVGRQLSEILPAEFCDSLKEGRPVVRTVPTDSSVLLLAYEPTPLGQLAGCLFIRDVGAHQKLARKVTVLQAEAKHLCCLACEPPVELFITDGAGITLHVSNSERLYGVPESALVGRSVRELEREGYFFPSLTPLVQTAKQPVTVLQETKTGRKIMCRSSPILNPDGTIRFIVTVSWDVTELYYIKQQLTEIEDCMQRLPTPPSQDTPEKVVVAHSPEMREVVRSIRQIARFDSTVLLEGESGTGKDMLARLLHKLSRRKDGPFVKVNCGAIPETLMESELFGYAPGAFTGAQRTGKKGLLETANFGTLMLDEVDSLPFHLQAKLLHVVQDREFVPVGGVKPHALDVRIVAATNKHLRALVERGEFREDLYFRLAVVPVYIPPLRERREDILPLAAHFLESLRQRYGIVKRLDESARTPLLEYDWPGNVRELENVLERCVVTLPGQTITAEGLLSCLRSAELARAAGESLRDPEFSIEKVANETSMGDRIAEVEKKLLVEALQSGGSTRKAAEKLGVSQSTVVRKMKRFGLSPLN